MTAREDYLDGTHVRCVGDGPPIVLIHGVGADLEMWMPLTRHLCATRRVVVYDVKGHGKSAKPAGPYSLEEFVQQLDQLVGNLSLRSFDLLGFSMGGLIAQGFALAHPAKLNHMVLLNTVYERSLEERYAVKVRVAESLSGGYVSSVNEAIHRWFTPGFAAAHPDIVEGLRQRMIANDRAAYASAYAVFATADEELAPQVSKIATPTLVITGTDDLRSTPQMAKKLAATLPNGSLQLLSGQRHMTPVEVPGDVARLVLEFLGRSTQTAARVE